MESRNHTYRAMVPKAAAITVVLVSLVVAAALALAACGSVTSPSGSPSAAPKAGASGGTGMQHGLVWKFETGAAVHSSPAVVGGVVYFGSDDGFLYAIDSATGEERWRYRTDGTVCSSPAVSDGVVFVASDDGRLHAVDAAEGGKRWEFEIGEAGCAWRGWQGRVVLSSPAVSRGLVYIGSPDGHLYALDSATGRQRWRFKPVEVLGSPSPVLWRPSPAEVRRLPGVPVYSSPVIAGRLVYVHDSLGVLHALDKATGRWRWSFETGAEIGSSPAISRGVVYEGRYALDAATGKTVWAIGMTNHIAFATPAMSDGMVYVRFAGWGPYLAALDGRNGREEWTFDTDDVRLKKDNMPVLSSAAVSDGLVYVGSEDGYLYARDGRTGVEEWRFRPGRSVSSAPTVADGVIYFGSYDGCLYAVK